MISIKRLLCFSSPLSSSSRCLRQWAAGSVPSIGFRSSWYLRRRALSKAFKAHWKQFCWGILTICQSFIHGRGQLIAIRLLIGMMEAGFYRKYYGRELATHRLMDADVKYFVEQQPPSLTSPSSTHDMILPNVSACSTASTPSPVHSREPSLTVSSRSNTLPSRVGNISSLLKGR